MPNPLLARTVLYSPRHAVIAPALQAGLRAYWPAGVNFAAELLDTTPLTDGDGTGVTFGAGKVSSAAAGFIDGDEYLVGEPTSNTLITSGALTLAAWFRTESNGTIFVQRTSAADDEAYDYGLRMLDGDLLFIMGNGVTAQTRAASGFDDGDWHQAVGIFRTGYMGLWVDGVEQDAGVSVGISDVKHDGTVILVGAGFIGDVDGVGIWDVAFDASTVSYLWNAGAGRVPAAP